jgi:activating signal cointegrator complex subunit 2
MSLPQFAPFPDVKVRQNVLPAEWTAYLDTWASLAELHLRLSDIQFRHTVTEDGSSLTAFLVSFFHELANDDTLVPQTLLLRKKCFFLLHRLYSGENLPAPLLSWAVLSDTCRIFSRSTQFRTLLDGLWKRKAALMEKSLQPAKNSLIRNLDSKRPEEAQSTLDKIAPLLRLSPATGTYMITGSDFLDSLCNAYPSVTPPLQAKLAATAYLGLVSLLEGEKPNFSVLSDHLYSLKANGEQQARAGAAQTSLIADLVTNTPLLHKIRDKATAPEAMRVKNFAASLSSFQQSSVARPKKLVKRKIDKGKSKATGDEYGHGALGEIHVHRMSMISQIQDLFPDLGSGFVVKLLDEYNDNIEEVTAHLLEDSLPPHLADADRSEPL